MEINGSISDNLSGATQLTSSSNGNNGVRTLNTANTYSGLTLINGGVLVAADSGALGSTATGTTVAGNGLSGRLALTGDITIAGEALTLGARQSTIIDVPHVINLTGNNTWSGNVTFDIGGSDYNFESQADLLTIDGEISAGGLGGNRNLKLFGAGDGEVSGAITNGTSTAIVQVTKRGSGTWTLSGANSYSGNTTVEDGTLSITQPNFADTSTVTIGTVLDSPAVLNLPNAGTDVVTALVIDGVSQPGDGAVYDSSNSGGAITGSGKIQVGTPPASGYSTWATANAGGQTADLDFDNDGVDNGVEYFLGATGSGFTQSPTTFANKKATWTNGGKIAKEQYGIQFWIQKSTDLVGWTDVASDDPNLENVDGSVSYTLTGSGKEFMRLKVTPSPLQDGKRCRPPSPYRAMAWQAAIACHRSPTHARFLRG
jgi:autotransporter-associated beta strand protein